MRAENLNQGVLVMRPANQGMAQRIAEQGYAVLMPNVFHRYSRITPDGFESENEAERPAPLPLRLAVTRCTAQLSRDLQVRAVVVR